MKKLTLLFVLVVVAACTNAQVKLEDVVKPGSKLIYAVEANGSKYDFIVTLQDKNGSSFAWEMTAPASIQGKIIHTKTALQSAANMWNYLGAETKTLDDNTLSVWISQKVLTALNNKESVAVGMSSPDAAPNNMAVVSEADFDITVDGKKTSIHENVAKPVLDAGGTIKVNEASSDYFTYNNAPGFPVILRMNAGTNFYFSGQEQAQ